MLDTLTSDHLPDGFTPQATALHPSYRSQRKHNAHGCKLLKRSYQYLDGR